MTTRHEPPPRISRRLPALSTAMLLIALAVTAAAYWSGLYGGFLFDDYPNIVDNHNLQIHDASVPSLVRAAMSSPSSEFKRPLASLSFAANYLATGLDPFWMKLTNLVIHLLNGLLVFLLARRLMMPAESGPGGKPGEDTTHWNDAAVRDRAGMVAALIAGAWMLLPINLTGVLYVVQRMESMANLFVLLGLLGYVAGRQRMLAVAGRGLKGFSLCTASLVVPTAIGLTVKETTVMLPLYAFLVEWAVYRGRSGTSPDARRERRIWALFAITLFLPMLAGLAWIVPKSLSAGAFATRDFTLGQRLLSEARIVLDYIPWTLLPTPGALSFYHDDFHISTGLFSPWTTVVSVVLLGALAGLTLWVRRRAPLVALGLAWFLGAQLLTGTILPLELIYEHRNYFASFGLLLALVPLLVAPSAERTVTTGGLSSTPNAVPADGILTRPLPMALPRHALMAGLLMLWIALTSLTAHAWGDPLRLSRDLAARAPQSPRAQYELGRTYIIYSHYRPGSPFTALAYAPLERAMRLPGSSILPEQALIFMNARMKRPLKDSWWDSMTAKLAADKPGVQDESSLGALTRCAREGSCDLPKQRMMDAFLAALGHPDPRSRLLAIYGDYAWNVLEDHDLGVNMTAEATKAEPDEPAYRITLIRMLLAQGEDRRAREQLENLRTLNVGGRLDVDLRKLERQIPRGKG